MTSSCMRMNCKPFLLKGVTKDYIWGGRKLCTEFDKELSLGRQAESWECSTHPDGESLVASGEFTGQTLLEVLRLHPEFLGKHPLELIGDGTVELPVMIKLIDARQDLSVQVHPNDEYAAACEGGQHGKTEMWYVIEAEKDASLVYGLKETMEPEQLKRLALAGELDNCLQHVPVKKNDVFFIEAGTIHAIGAGTLIAEVQENSNLTYRLYDYGRGRGLQVDKALQVASTVKSQAPRQPMRKLEYTRGCARELLSRCKYFETYRMLINTERCRQLCSFAADEESFRVLLCTSGCGVMQFNDGDSLNYFRGDCIFVPAGCEAIRLHGKAEFLDVRG